MKKFIFPFFLNILVVAGTFWVFVPLNKSVLPENPYPAAIYLLLMFALGQVAYFAADVSSNRGVMRATIWVLVTLLAYRHISMNIEITQGGIHLARAISQGQGLAIIEMLSGALLGMFVYFETKDHMRRQTTALS